MPYKRPFVVGDPVVIVDNEDCAKEAPGEGTRGIVVYVAGGGRHIDVEVDCKDDGLNEGKERWGYTDNQLEHDGEYNGERLFKIDIAVRQPSLWYSRTIKARNAVEAFRLSENELPEFFVAINSLRSDDAIEKLGYKFERISSAGTSIVDAESMAGLSDRVSCIDIVAREIKEREEQQVVQTVVVGVTPEEHAKGMMMQKMIAELMATFTVGGRPWHERLAELERIKGGAGYMSTELGIELEVLRECEQTQRSLKHKAIISFPGYADDIVLPGNTTDLTEGNDTCPSFGVQGIPYGFFVDHADNDRRESPDSWRFSIFHIEEDDETSREHILSTDDWQEVRAYISARVLEATRHD